MRVGVLVWALVAGLEWLVAAQVGSACPPGAAATPAHCMLCVAAACRAGVAAVFGSTYNGEFEDVAAIDAMCTGAPLRRPTPARQQRLRGSAGLAARAGAPSPAVPQLPRPCPALPCPCTLALRQS